MQPSNAVLQFSMLMVLLSAVHSYDYIVEPGPVVRATKGLCLCVCVVDYE